MFIPLGWTGGVESRTAASGGSEAWSPHKVRAGIPRAGPGRGAVKADTQSTQLAISKGSPWHGVNSKPKGRHAGREARDPYPRVSCCQPPGHSEVHGALIVLLVIEFLDLGLEVPQFALQILTAQLLVQEARVLGG